MTDDKSSPTAQQGSLLEPEQTGTTPHSQSTSVTVLPAITPEDQKKGLQGSNVLWPAFEALLTQGAQQVTEVSKVFAADYERRFNTAAESNERLQDELRKEQVAHARTQQRLDSLLEKDRKSAFITALGGVLLGLGLKDFALVHGKIFAGVGLALLIVGCWSLVPKSRSKA